MKLIGTLIISIFMIAVCFGQAEFKTKQLKYARVRTAYMEKEAGMKLLLQENSIDTNSFSIFIRAFKKQEIIELWAKDASGTKYKLLKTYNFCLNSGILGPKREQGDNQIPEGFYFIERFNPASSFYLSLGINYPNSSDKILKSGSDPGGDIFIHGDCVTIGCIPITDVWIKELYIFAVEAKSNGQNKIPVHIFPSKLDDNGFLELEGLYANNIKLINFWKNLKEGYTYFETNRSLARFSISESGEYVFH